jgi:hypothetical protein
MRRPIATAPATQTQIVAVEDAPLTSAQFADALREFCEAHSA